MTGWRGRAAPIVAVFAPAIAFAPGAVIVGGLAWPIVKAELLEVGALRRIRRLRFCRPVMPEQQLSITIRGDRGRRTFGSPAPTPSSRATSPWFTERDRG